MVVIKQVAYNKHI